MNPERQPPETSSRSGSPSAGQRYEKPQPGHRLQVDVKFLENGAEFQSRFHWHLESRDVRHVYIQPRTPHLNGKVERSHRVDDQNYHRPHGALKGQTPFERLMAKTRADVVPRV